VFKRQIPKLLCLAFCAGVSFSAEIVVPDQVATIQGAIDVAGAGDVIRVQPGLYAENLNFGGKNIAVRGVGGAKQTILDARGQTGIVIGPGGEVSGLTISNAVASFGAGMAVSGVGTIIRSNIFVKNIQTAGGFGAGIAGNNSSPIIEQNIFMFHSADSQFLSGVLGFVNGSSPRISNNLFLSNDCRAINLTLPEGNAPIVENNTIIGNQVGVHHGYFSTVVYRNNIIFGNTIGLEESGGDFQNNLIFGNETDYVGMTAPVGTVEAAPLFYDPSRLDFRLTRNSPGVDQGVAGTTVDLLGRVRPIDGDLDGSAITDIGAYEYIPAPPEAPENLVVRSTPEALSLTWQGRPETTSFVVKRATQPGGPYTVTFTTSTPAFVDTTTALQQEYYYVVAGVNDIGEGPNSAEGHERAGNRPPVAKEDQITVDEDTPIVFAPLENDSDPDGDEVHLASVTGPGATMVNDSIQFEPPKDFSGTMELEYVATDGRAAYATNRVIVTVKPVNDPPVAQGRSYNVEIGSAVDIVLSATDIDSSVLGFELVNAPVVGRIENFSTNGTLRYVAGRSSVLTDSFEIRAFDAESFSAPVEITIRRIAPRDLDRDGLPDYWETLYDLNNPNGDRDGDCMLNSAEYLANTDPTDAQSVVALVGITNSGPSELLLKWKAVGQVRYRLQIASSLAGPFGDVVRDVSAEVFNVPDGVSGIAELQYGVDPTQSARFFRIKVVP
jgi:hypothetical protein